MAPLWSLATARSCTSLEVAQVVTPSSRKILKHGQAPRRDWLLRGVLPCCGRGRMVTAYDDQAKHREMHHSALLERRRRGEHRRDETGGGRQIRLAWSMVPDGVRYVTTAATTTANATAAAAATSPPPPYATFHTRHTRVRDRRRETAQGRAVWRADRTLV